MSRQRKARVCVYGCGAIGSLLAYRLAAVSDVSVVARGAQLEAIRRQGLRCIDSNGAAQPPVSLCATDDPATLTEQDAVFLTLKAHDLPAAASRIAPLLGAQTPVVTAANGFPWWYFEGAERPSGLNYLEAVDPGGELWRAIQPARAIGCIVYPAATLVSPGEVRHVFGERFTLGEPAGGRSERLERLAELLGAAGFAVHVPDDMRPELWSKLMANAAYNPVSVLTGMTLGEMIADPATGALLKRVMGEVATLAEALGSGVAMTADELLEATRPLGAHRTSMFQDVAAGRKPETGPVLDALLTLATHAGIATPTLATVRALLAAKLGEV